MKVVSFKICPFVQRVTALLEAKRIAYEVEFIDLSDKPDWFLEISPNAQVPVLITDEGKALFESDAIAEYLEEAFPALQPGLSAENRATNWACISVGKAGCGAVRTFTACSGRPSMSSSIQSSPTSIRYLIGWTSDEETGR